MIPLVACIRESGRGVRETLVIGPSDLDDLLRGAPHRGAGAGTPRVIVPDATFF